MIGGILEIIEDNKIRSAIASNTLDLPKGKPKEEYIEFLRNTFTHKVEKELKALTSFIEEMPSNVPLDEEHHDQIKQRVIEFGKKRHQIIPLTMILGFFSFLGLWYVLSRIP